MAALSHAPPDRIRGMPLPFWSIAAIAFLCILVGCAAIGYGWWMEAPTSAGRESQRGDSPSRLAWKSLILGLACFAASSTATILCSPIGFGELIHHIQVWRNIVPRVLYWVAIWTSFMGPVPTAFAIWQGGRVYLVRGILLLLAQMPLFLSVAHWIITKLIPHFAREVSIYS